MTKEEKMAKLNGRRVKFTDKDARSNWNKVDALILCPPGGKKISFKPYGYTPAELSILSEAANGLEWYQRPEYCFGTMSLEEEKFEKYGGKIVLHRSLDYILEIPEGGEMDFDEMIASGNAKDLGGVGGGASCPHG